MLARRDALGPECVREAGERWADRLLGSTLWREARRPALYMAFGGELSTRPLLACLWAAGVPVVLPRVVGSTLTLHRVATESELVRGRFGIPEPAPDAPEVPPTEPDLIVVPGVAFDRSGNRIGFGKGYYDRLLESASARTVGAAYAFQILESVPTEPHDRRMDFLMTPEWLVDCREPGARA